MSDDQNRVVPEQRLFDAVARWNTETGFGTDDLIDTACLALGDGLDSPALRELAGASPRDRLGDLEELVGTTFDELQIPLPGTLRSGQAVAAGGGTVRRPGVDAIRFEVADVPDESGSGFQVLVYVNGVEMTAAGAGLGMDPYDVFVPENRLVATAGARTIPIARCECGVYGCGSTDVTIVRDDDLVHWDWLYEVPINRGVSFAAAEYDNEVARLAANYDWETPDRTAGRLILRDLDRQALRAHGLKPSWVANDYRNSAVFRVALQLGNSYQVFVDFPWTDHTPAELAHSVCQTLSQRPRTWDATWHAIQPSLTHPPKIAGRSWQQAKL
ncbi:hypothetical protein ACIBG5_26780 [Kribbella sp. NPDC050241]|uniref:hypothetical protein n=1 Tax=Kribbella sp. NPDC050241 TaxID=3364115 RepID=UPI0037B13D6A